MASLDFPSPRSASVGPLWAPLGAVKNRRTALGLKALVTGYSLHPLGSGYQAGSDNLFGGRAWVGGEVHICCDRREVQKVHDFVVGSHDTLDVHLSRSPFVLHSLSFTHLYTDLGFQSGTSTGSNLFLLFFFCCQVIFSESANCPGHIRVVPFKHAKGHGTTILSKTIKVDMNTEHLLECSCSALPFRNRSNIPVFSLPPTQHSRSCAGLDKAEHQIMSQTWPNDA